MEIKEALAQEKRGQGSQLITDEKGREWRITPTSPAIRESQQSGRRGLYVVNCRLTSQEWEAWSSMLNDLGVSGYRMLQTLIRQRLARHEQERRIRAGCRAKYL